MSPMSQSVANGLGQPASRPHLGPQKGDARLRRRVGQDLLMLDEIEREMGRRLRWLRRARGMTQEAVAEPCGVSFQQIQKYETASSRISAAMLLRLAAALRVDVGFFYEGLRDRRFAAGAAPPDPAVVSKAC